MSIQFVHADTTSRAVIDALQITSFDSIQVLCYADELEIQEADAQTLITLLHLRRICDETGKDVKIVSEMLDIRNRDLAVVTKANDFIVSDKLISLLMSQVSENKYLMSVFDDLFDAEGSEIYLKPVSNYVIRAGQ
jgi:ion channel POLLUX/CASTOR